jgi:hypothetical protein
MLGHYTVHEVIVAWLIQSAVGVVVFLHADKNGSRHPTAWGVSMLPALGIALPLYLLHVYRQRRRRRV